MHCFEQSKRHNKIITMTYSDVLIVHNNADLWLVQCAVMCCASIYRYLLTNKPCRPYVLAPPTMLTTPERTGSFPCSLTGRLPRVCLPNHFVQTQGLGVGCGTKVQTFPIWDTPFFSSFVSRPTSSPPIRSQPTPPYFAPCYWVATRMSQGSVRGSRVVCPNRVRDIWDRADADLWSSPNAASFPCLGENENVFFSTYLHQWK